MPSTKITLEKAQEYLKEFNEAYCLFYRKSDKHLQFSRERTNTKEHDFYVQASKDVKEFVNSPGFSNSWIWELFISDQSTKPVPRRRYFSNTYIKYFEDLIIFYQDHVFIKYDDNGKTICQPSTLIDNALDHQQEIQESSSSSYVKKLTKNKKVIWLNLIIGLSIAGLILIGSLGVPYIIDKFSEHESSNEQSEIEKRNDISVLVDSMDEKRKFFQQRNYRPVFSSVQNIDTLNILITRFEEVKRDTINENNCVGFSINNRVDQLVHFKSLPINCVYTNDLNPPREIAEAKVIQQYNNADILIWGFSTNFKEECGEGEICFMSSPSNAMINMAGGDFVNPEKLNIQYESFDSIEMQEGGTELHVNGFAFENWLTTMVFLKTQKKSPQFFVIPNDLSIEERFEKLMIRSKMFKSLRLSQKAIGDLDSALLLKPENTDALLMRAELSAQRRNYPKSIKDFDELITLNPMKPYTYIRRARVKNSMGDYDSAERDFSKAIEIEPSNSNWYRNRATFYKQNENYTQAIKDYSEAIRLNPNDAKLYGYRARLYRDNELGKYDLAEEDYSKAIELEPTNPWRYIGRAGFYSSEVVNEYGKAENDYSEAVKLDSNNYRAIKERADFYAKKVKNYSMAEKDYSKIIEINPEDYMGYLDRGKFYKDKVNLFNLAEQDYNKSISLDSSSQKSYLLRSSLYEGLGRFDLAEKDLEKALSIHPSKYNLNKIKEQLVNLRLKRNDTSSIVSLLFKGGEKYLDKDYIGSIQYFDQVISIDSTNQNALLLRGKANYRLGKYEEAEKDCFSYTNHHSHDFKVYNLLGNIARKKKQYEMAIDYYTKTIELNNMVYIAYNNRGLCLNKLGLNDKAEEDYKKAMKLNPNYYGSHVNLLVSILFYRYWYFTISFCLISIYGFFRHKQKKNA